MQNYNRLLAFLVFMIPVICMGQHSVNNPYSRYGIGELINSGFSYNRALGGSTIGLRTQNQINPLNPASYTSQDTLSFLFQAGISGQRSHLTTDIDEKHMNVMNIEYLAMGFPITRWFKFSLGLLPYNRVSYYYNEYQEIGEDIAIENRGNGGFNDFYAGGSIQPFKFLSIGINAGYLFGRINRTQNVIIPDQLATGVAGTQIKDDYVASDFRFSTGIQLHPVFKDSKDRSHKIVLGAIYDLPASIKVNYNSLASRNFPSGVSNQLTDTFRMVVDSSIHIDLPVKYGVGFSYTFDERFMITMEYSKQKFSEGIGINAIADLTDYSSIRFGADYIPVPLTSRERVNYFQRVRYSIGGHYTNTCLNINNTPITDYGISFGLSLPLKNQQKLYTYSTVNLTYEYGIRGTTDNGLIKDNYHLITIGILLHDYWFMKPKYD